MPLDQSKPAPRRHDWLFAVAVLFAGLTIGYLLADMIGPYWARPVVDLRGNIDWGYLNRGLSRVHNFRDTARWWTGTWCGEVPFWRPLTSYVFWVMKLVWRPEYMLPREFVLIALHLCFIGLSALLLWRLTHRKWLVVLAVWLFSGIRPYPMTSFFGICGAVVDVLSDPKNIVDPLAGIPMIASLLLLVSGRWKAALIAAAVSVGFKETGFVTWPLALITLAWMHRDKVLACGGIGYAVRCARKNLLPVAAWLFMLGVLAVIHLAAVGLGYNCGTNGAWQWRAMAYFGGPIGAQLAIRDFGPPIVALLLFVYLMVSRGLSLLPRFFGALAALAIGIIIDSHIQRISWDVSAVRLMVYSPDLKSIIVGVVWLMVAWEARRDWRIVVLSAAACFVAAAPSWMAAQVQEHARYLASLFMEVVVSASLCASVRALSRYCRRPAKNTAPG